MKEKIMTFLKGKLQGTSESYLNAVSEHYSKSITEESQIEATLNDGVIGLLKLNAEVLQKEGDRRATEATKTAVKNAFEKLGLDENGNKKETNSPNPTNPPQNPDDTTKKMEEFFNSKITPLQQELAAFKKKEIQQTLQTKVIAKLKEKGVSEKYYNGRITDLENEEAIDALVTQIETGWKDLVQEYAEAGVHLIKPASSGSGIKEGEALGKEIAAQRNSDTGEGKKI